MSDEHATIGKTVIEYTANSRHIACLEKQLSDIGEQLTLLGQKLKNAPGDITAIDRGFQIPDQSPWQVESGNKITMPFSDFDTAKIREILSELSEAKQDRVKLERTLRGMGLADLIKESSS